MNVPIIIIPFNSTNFHKLKSIKKQESNESLTEWSNNIKLD